MKQNNFSVFVFINNYFDPIIFREFAVHTYWCLFIHTRLFLSIVSSQLYKPFRIYKAPNLINSLHIKAMELPMALPLFLYRDTDYVEIQLMLPQVVSTERQRPVQ